MPAILSSVTQMALQAATPSGGFALQNATPTVISWTTPNDGALHRFAFFSSIVVTSGETGGQVQVQFTAPDGSTAVAFTLSAGTQANGFDFSGATRNFTCAPNTTVSIKQSTALSAGAAKIWAEIWGS